jgi:hypothetical protein
MAGVPAPRKYSNFPFTETLTANQTFLVADPDAGENYQITAPNLAQYVEDSLPPRPIIFSANVELTTLAITEDQNLDQTLNGITLYYSGNADITLTFSNTTTDNVSFSVINFNTDNAAITINYNGFNTVSAPTTLLAGKMTFTKVANTIIGK